MKKGKKRSQEKSGRSRGFSKEEEEEEDGVKEIKILGKEVKREEEEKKRRGKKEEERELKTKNITSQDSGTVAHVVQW